MSCFGWSPSCARALKGSQMGGNPPYPLAKTPTKNVLWCSVDVIFPMLWYVIFEIHHHRMYAMSCYLPNAVTCNVEIHHHITYAMSCYFPNAVTCNIEIHHHRMNAMSCYFPNAVTCNIEIHHHRMNAMSSYFYNAVTSNIEIHHHRMNAMSCYLHNAVTCSFYNIMNTPLYNIDTALQSFWT